MAWTVEQQQAIDEEGTNIIVSAGAGSGKTAVLTERVKRKLLNGVHVNQLLVLTFTNAAAQEMKERIRAAIQKTPSIQEEANYIDGAYITTFDSFSLSMVKKYHTKLNITDKIVITEDVIIEKKKKELLDEILDEYYLSPKQDFMKLIQDYCLKDDQELKNYLLNAYKKIELKYDKEEYFNHFFSYEMTEEKLNGYLEEYLNILKSKQKDMKRLIEDLNEYFDGDFVGKVFDALRKMLEASTYDDFRNSLDFASVRVPKNSDETGKKIKQELFDIAKSMKEYCLYDSVEDMKKEYFETKESISVIVSILKEFDKRLENYKRENDFYNFTDIARLAIKVVSENPEIRKELRDSFHEILVDEYQDTSDTLEMFISLISNHNVYMVGDIKQSIYRFRNANPSIFKNKYNLYRDTNQGVKIDLLKNFRSRREVLDNINLLFDLFMDDEIGGAEYRESHRMVFGNESYEEEGKTEQNYNLDVIVYDSDSLGQITKEEEEAFIIGRDIQKKMDEKMLIFDKDKKMLRPIEYRDFVILLDKSKHFDLYKKIFEYLHIPLHILKEESLKKDEDVLVIKNLLTLIICIHEGRFDSQFQYSYISISRSFLYKLSDQEIYEIFTNNNYSSTALYQKCLKVSQKIDSMSASGFLNYVLEEFQYEEKLLTIGKIKSFRIRSEYFYNLCKSYETMGNTIYDFVAYLDDILEGDYDLKFNVNTSSSNSCKIMTIHKSKGLEFPICYFAGFSSKFSISELKEKILYDHQYGFILPVVHESYKDTFLKTIYKNNYKREDISERIRLLYVAVTRAKEKMIIVMPKQEEEVERLDFVPTYEREKYHSFLSIMKSIYSVLLPFIKETDVIGTKDYLNTVSKREKVFQNQEDSLIVKELDIPSEFIEEKHYSKENLHFITKEEKEKMDFGTKVHAILEEINFQDYDLSLYPVSPFIKEKIEAFLQSSFMKDKLSSKMYKEYEFLYTEENRISHGIIDLLIEQEDKMIIIDYKLKNIEDQSYEKQLNGYRRFVEEKTHKKTECYLYSLLDGNYKEVPYA